MARLPLLDDTDRPDLVPLATHIREQRGGRLLNLYRVLMHSPTVAEAWLLFFTAIRQKCDLSARARELAILQVALLNGARYEYEQHVPFARAAGVTDAQFAALEAWEASTLFPSEDRAVLAYTTAMTRNIRVPDDVFAAVRAHFAPAQVVELTATIGGYNLVSRFLEALQVDHE